MRTAEERFALRLLPEPRRTIETIAREGYPNETCGLLIGSRYGRQTTVTLAIAAQNLNTERSRDRYVLDPDDFARADSQAAAYGQDVVGIWHSHPDHPAEPSQTDLDTAWSGYSYVIVSVTNGRPDVVRSWRLRDGRFEEERFES